MMQRYQKACSVFFKHDFFSDGSLKALMVKPTPETERKLRNAGAIMVPFASGIHLLYDSFHTGTERSRIDFLANEDSFQFLLLNNDTNFYSYTAGFDTDISRNCLFLGNNSCALATGKEVLHVEAFVGKEDRRMPDAGDRNFFAKPFAMLELHMRKELENSLTITFSSTATYWCYVLSTAHLQELVKPAIVNKETKEVFAASQVWLPDDKMVPAFFSSSPIPHQQRMKNTFQLVEEYNQETHSYKIVSPSLPGPNPKYISSVKTTAEHQNKNLSFIFI